MRLFVAVDLPATVKDELERLSAALRTAVRDARWVPRDNLHLTLVFLGEVAEQRLDDVGEALRNAVVATDPFAARIAETGAFPSARRARVLWAGLDSDHDRLPRLAAAAAAALEPLGFPPEKREWTAHLTLARLRVPANVSEVPPLTVEPVGFTIREITLFRSRLGRPAPRYEPLLRVPLGG